MSSSGMFFMSASSVVLLINFASVCFFGSLSNRPSSSFHEDDALCAEHLGMDEETEVRAVRGQDALVLRRRLPEVVRRRRDHDRQHACLEIERQLPEVLALHDD